MLSKSEFDMKHSEDEVLASDQFGKQSKDIKPPETPSKKAAPDWNSKLNLKNSDKDIFLNEKSWLTDSRINAAMALMKTNGKSSVEYNGMEDVLVTQANGFTYNPKAEKFIQMININHNHWVTISNVFCESSQFEAAPGHFVRPIAFAKVYDSLQSLNEKNGKVNYPFSVEKAICELNRPTVAVQFIVEDVPQQDGGSDCGLFAIAFAASLCQNINPNSLVIKQQAMRPAFLKCIDNNDLSTFLNDIVLSRSRLFKNDPLTSTQVRLYCHCKMPDNGELMVKCKRCKEWFHEACEKGDFENDDWLCCSCEEIKKWRESKLKPDEGKRKKLLLSAETHPQESRELHYTLQYVDC